jgi:aminoglycoside 6'-N-acetyltransferase
VGLRFRRVTREDFRLLSDWFSRGHVEPWWREAYDAASIEKNYGPCVDGLDPTELFVVESEGNPIGFAQRYSIDEDANWKSSLAPSGEHDNAVGIDYLIGEEALTGTGLGPQIIDAFVNSAWERYPGAEEIVVAVHQANRRSWRALEKAGFERTWSGDLSSDDPSDVGPSFVYVRRSTWGMGAIM